MSHIICFSDSNGCVHWHGKLWEGDKAFIDYLNRRVRIRLMDDEHSVPFKEDLRGLAAGTAMNATILENLLSEEVPKEPWEIGESLAECLLEDEGVKWPWNTERDKRTPKASLPGADLIGFIETQDGATLLLGEVKTSTHTEAPPQVMTGRSGMIHQLEQLAKALVSGKCSGLRRPGEPWLCFVTPVGRNTLLEMDGDALLFAKLSC